MRRWLKRLGILVGILLITELLLRLLGFVSGFTGTASGEYLDLRNIDSLIVRQTFSTDSLGIFRALPQAFGDRPDVQINSRGFRGKDWEEINRSGEGKRLLLLGDSFTWGANAQPITRCFADRLDSMGYRVYNTGIPGTEPDQYAKVAQHIIPELKPDAVCVFFYMANDILYAPIEVGPYQQRYHITQAGWFNAFLDAHYEPDAQSSYEYYQKRYTVPSSTFFNRFCAQTATGTLLWRGLRRLGWLSQPWHPDVAPHIQKAEQERSEHPISYRYLKEIYDLCQSHQLAFFLFVIPVHTDLDPEIPDSLFRELPYYLPDHLQREHYREWPDGHFNNEGHRIFADFVAQALRSSLGQ